MAQAAKCIGIIVDGNRRWAQARNLPTLEGHRLGLEKVHELMRWARDAGVGYVIVYAFSTENWNRSAEEVGYLMNLFRKELFDEMERWRSEGVRLRFVGQRERLAPDIQSKMTEAEQITQDSAVTLVVALSYGGRPEILEAVNSLLRSGQKEEVDEETFAQRLWTKDIPDPDLIIRTGGEQRLSNFLPWQSVYSELFFTPTLWPDFSEEEFKNILDDFAQRERRFGK